jgi:hypothetical protein
MVCLFSGLTLSAQGPSSRVNTLADEIVRNIQNKKPGWRYQEVEPIDGSVNVALQQWTFEQRSVKIRISLRASESEGINLMRDLRRDGRPRETPADLGDEAVAWGNNAVSFRDRDLIVDVTTSFGLSNLSLEKVASNRVEERKLSEEFARLVAEILRRH